jgi:hypothetical protein
MNILLEFEKEYKLRGKNPKETMLIAGGIAVKHNLNIEAVTDYIHIFRYEDDAPSFEAWVKGWQSPLDK